jgi:hypothetical protein
VKKSFTRTKRKFDEMNLHESLWRILSAPPAISSTNGSNSVVEENTVPSEIVYCLLRILLDPVSIPIDKTIGLFEEYLI